LDWLDAMPMTRRRLWRVKCGSSAAVAAVQVLLLSALGFGLGAFDPKGGRIAFLLVPLAYGLSGWSSGLFGSAVGRTALGAFGWAIVVQFALALVGGLVIAPFADAMRDSAVARGVAIGVFLAILALPLVASARLFGRLDRLRRAAAPPEQSTSWRGWRSLIWLTWRQGRVVWSVVLIAGLPLAISLPYTTPDLWPALGMVLGLVAGLGVFGTDQAGDAYRFLGERRVPPGRLWLAKLAVRFAPLAAVLTAYMLFGLARMTALEVEYSTTGRGDTTALDRLRHHFDCSLVLLGPISGFALGQFFGLVCRKGAVAAVLALFCGFFVWAAWMPSLVFGGVHWWQWVGPPLLLLGATRLTVWPWVSGRLVGVKLLGLAAVVLLAGAGVGAGVAYRVLEVPVRTDPFDVAAFEASLPKPEQNEAGRAIAQALRRFHSHLVSVDEQFDAAVTLRPGAQWLYEYVNNIVTSGMWPTSGFGGTGDRWLDAMLNDRWYPALQAAVRLPLGRVMLGGQSLSGYDYQTLEQAAQAGTVVLAKALRSLHRGESAAALDDLFLVLDLSRHLRSRTNGPQFLTAVRMETTALTLVPMWGAKSAEQPALLRRAIERLRAHETDLPPLIDVLKTDYVMQLDFGRQPRDPQQMGLTEIENDLVRTAMNVPWEQFRNRGTLATLYAGLLRTAETSYPDALRRITEARQGQIDQVWILDGWTPPAEDVNAARRDYRRLANLLRTSQWWNTPIPDGPYLFGSEALARVQSRAALLQLAFNLYQTEHGKPAETLAALVPTILPTLPADPFGDGPFHYRVSPGEDVVWYRARAESSTRRVDVGQGVLWSVGPDLQDNGGRENDPTAWPYSGWKPGADMLFLVPVVRKP
jgi:hypothetical protein